MRKILLLLFLLWNLSSLAWATNWCSDDAAVGCWDFSDGSGNITDQTNSNDCVITNSPTWGEVTGTNAPEYAAYAVTFNGSNQYANCGSDVSLSVSYITSVLWIYPETTMAATETYFSRHQASSPYGPWDMRRHGDSDRYGVSYATVTPGNTWAEIYSDSASDVDEWVHLAFTWGGTAGQALIYVNGIEETNYKSGNTISGVLHGTAGDLNMGRNPSYSRYFDGKITEAAIFDEVKDSTDINDIMENGLVQVATSRRFIIVQ